MKSKLIIATATLSISCSTHCSEPILIKTLITTEKDPIAIRPAMYHDLDAISDLSQKNYHTNFKPLWEKHYATIIPQHHTIDSFVKEKADLNDKSNSNAIWDQTNDQNSTQKVLVAELTETQTQRTLSGGINRVPIQKIVGYCRFEKKDPQTMYINFILVAEEFRKCGIAKQLAQAAMNTFEGVTQCTFRALIHYDFINDLYTKHGCAQTGTVSLDASTGKISTNPNAPITHIDYSYAIKK